MTDSNARICGECSLCCVVLRVDELRKLGGTPCVHQRAEGGCGIHAQRPGICRAYQCLWLRGGLEDSDRPDRLGAVLDVVGDAGEAWLEIRQAEPGRFEHSPRLQEIAEQHRRSLPVRVTDSASVLDSERPFRVLLPDGSERLVTGEQTILRHPDGREESLRLPPLDRWLRRLRLRWRKGRIAHYPESGSAQRRVKPSV